MSLPAAVWSWGSLRWGVAFLLLCCALSSSASAEVAVLKSQEMKLTAVDPAFQPVELQLPEGFVAEVAAGPPLVEHPTMACLDDRGRLFVCENAGVNMSAAELEEHLPNSIRMLEDQNGDGIFDRSTVFADKMTFPMGGCWIDGSLYVASPPYIWKLTDTDDDGVADERVQLVSKFGYTGNAASIHGCFAGPDGRVYWCDGFHGHEFRDENGEVISKRSGSYLFSCRTDGSDVQIHCGGGMDNPVEVDFSPAGDVIGTVNIMLTRPRVDCLVHWQRGGTYPHREKVLEEMKTTGDFLGPIHRFGHVAISGTMRYRSGLLEQSWRDNFFATFFNSGKVVRLELTPEGSTFKTVQREFLSSSNRDFHPTDVLEDVDGSLLVLDTGGWFYRGCPTSQLAKPDIQGAIYRIRREGMTPAVDPNGSRIAWKKLSAEALLSYLKDSRERVQQHAIRECVRRGAEMIVPLRGVVERGDIGDRTNALWAIVQLLEQAKMKTGGLTPAHVQDLQEGVRSALQDEQARLRQIACHALMYHPDSQATERLQMMLKDETPAVRRMAATALGTSGQKTAVPALLQALDQAGDREEEHAILYALIELNDPVQLAKGMGAGSPRIRRGCLLVLDQLQSQLLTPDVLVTALQDTDSQVQGMALELIGKGSRASEQMPLIRSLLEEQTSRETLSTDVQAQLFAAFSADDVVAEQIGQILQDGSGDAKLQQVLLSRLSQVAGLQLSPGWIPFLEQKLSSGEPAQIELVLPVVQASRQTRFNAVLEKAGSDRRLPKQLRLRLLMAVTGQQSGMNAEAFELLLTMLENPENTAELQQAGQLLGNATLSAPQLTELAPFLAEAGTSLLRDLIRPFARNSSAPVAEAFLTALEQSRFVVNVPQQEISDIIKSYPQELRERANRLIDHLRQQEQAKLRQMDRFLPLIELGTAEQGREIFFSEQAKCATCHKVGDQGKAVGPDLSNIGANRARRDLLESILFPSATIVRDYEAYTIALLDGRVLTGLLARETAETIELQQATGQIEQIPRNEIDFMAPSDVSVMPAGLEKELTDQQLADLIAYLATLKQSASQP